MKDNTITMHPTVKTSKFKVGDFVRHISIENEIVKVKRICYETKWVEVIEPTQLSWEVTRCYSFGSLEHWWPREGEWIIAYDKENKDIFAVVKYSDEVKEDLENGYWVDMKIEPYFGTLPSFINENY